MRVERTGFHLVDSSPWPIVVSLSVLLLTTSVVSMMHGLRGSILLVVSLVICVLSVVCWLRDVIREGTLEGQHNRQVEDGLRLGFMLFIVSEVMFFSGFFLSYFWLSMGTSVDVGNVHPVYGLEKVEGMGIALLNTLILLLSGASITWGHHSVLVGSRVGGVSGLLLTVVLGVVFSVLQGYEYVTSTYSISDGSYGSSFYMLTGFHGAHVIIGAIMILVALVRVLRYEQTVEHHFNLELSAIYWHFVDVVWLLLFILVYLM